MTRKRAIARSTAPAARRWLTLAALLAFFLQTLAVQTHIHVVEPAQVAKISVTHTAPAVPPKNQDPIDQCRLCQELVHAGSFITPSAALFAEPQTLVVAVFLAPTSARRAESAPAFSWQSRGPPQR